MSKRIEADAGGSSHVGGRCERCHRVGPSPPATNGAASDSPLRRPATYRAVLATGARDCAAGAASLAAGT